MSTTEFSLWCILILVVLAYLNYYYPQYSRSTLYRLFRESMTEMDKPPKVTLFGDSILNNSRYVPLGKSVGASLQDIYGKGLKIYAQDGASIHNVYNQVEQYKSYNDALGSSFDKNNTHLVISVGGNDLLNAMNVRALSDEKIEKFASQYERLIKHVRNTFPEAHLYLLNVYHPKEERYQKISKYIDKWNDTVSGLAERGDLKKVVLVDIDSIVVKEEDFVSEVEPSTKGSKKIARAIVNEINKFV